MRKLMSTLLLVAAVSSASATDPMDIYFDGKDNKLTDAERRAIQMAEKWQRAQMQGAEVSVGPDGSINYLFGATQPSVVCAVLQVCDVQLQPGEQVQSINLGDAVRWSVEPALTGTGANAIQHLIIKPRGIGLQTTLLVTTDRRTYNILLRSHKTKFMPRVTFTYPEDSMAKWEAIKQQVQQERVANTLPETKEYLGDLDFDYIVSGKAKWKPIRVYNDGRKTIIQMPQTMAQTESPSLLVVRHTPGWFNKDEQVMVNYRVQGDRYIVDSVFDEAIMIAGVGSAQTKVRILRGDASRAEEALKTTREGLK